MSRIPVRISVDSFPFQQTSCHAIMLPGEAPKAPAAITPDMVNNPGQHVKRTQDMPRVRAGADKWQRRASAASADYASGVQQPRTPWAQAVQDAVPAWEAGVQQAVAQGSYGRAATSEAQANWSQRAQTLGQQRYAPGINASKQRYEKGFAPYRQVIESTTLPPRGRRGDPNNMQRAVAMAGALADARQQKMKGG